MRRGGAVLARLEDRDREAAPAPPRRPAGRLPRRGGLPVDQPEVLARVRQRRRDLPRPEGADSALAQSAAFGLTFVLASLPSCFPWLAFGAVLQRVLRSERARRIFNGAMGALLAASVLLIFW